MPRLRPDLFLFLALAAVPLAAQSEADAEISRAVKSPEILAAYLGSRSKVDWKAVRSALGLREEKDWLQPCGGGFPAAEAPCVIQVERVLNPEQTILSIQGDEVSRSVEYLRYFGDAERGWRFGGEITATGHYETPTHRLTQFDGKPFLIVSADHSQAGLGVQQRLDEWIDLTQPDLDPAFSFTADGGSTIFGPQIARSFHSSFTASVTEGVERISVVLDLHFVGLGFDIPATFAGVYERTASERKFGLRRATVAPEDFKDLADPFGGPPIEKVLTWALPGLRKAAARLDADDQGWLRAVLAGCDDTPEKRTLLGLLGRP